MTVRPIRNDHSNPDTVFVYGTLKQGFLNHREYLAKAEFLGKARTIPQLRLIVAGPKCLPFLVGGSGARFRVAGEAYRVDDAILKKVDRLEGVGHPRGYYRQTIAIALEGDPMRELVAQAYFIENPPVPVHLDHLEFYQDPRTATENVGY